MDNRSDDSTVFQASNPIKTTVCKTLEVAMKQVYTKELHRNQYLLAQANASVELYEK